MLVVSALLVKSNKTHCSCGDNDDITSNIVNISACMCCRAREGICRTVRSGNLNELTRQNDMVQALHVSSSRHVVG